MFYFLSFMQSDESLLQVDILTFWQTRPRDVVTLYLCDSSPFADT